MTTTFGSWKISKGASTKWIIGTPCGGQLADGSKPQYSDLRNQVLRDRSAGWSDINGVIRRNIGNSPNTS
jgi:hypothetical protein